MKKFEERRRKENAARLFFTFWSSSAGTGSFFNLSISARAFAATSAGVFPSLASASIANAPAYLAGANSSLCDALAWVATASAGRTSDL
jgi:hypothetical protein